MGKGIIESRDYYQDYFSEESELTHDNKQRYEIIHSLISDSDVTGGASVLDVGAGSGRISRHLNRRFENVIAIDISATPLLRDVVGELNIQCAEGALPHLPFKDHSFELVVCSEVLEHIPERSTQALAVEELSRILAPNGYLVLSTPNPNSIHKRVRESAMSIAEKAGISDGEGGQLIENWIPPSDLKETLQMYLEIESAKGSYYAPPGFGTGIQTALEPLSDYITEKNLAPRHGLYQYYLARNSLS